MQQDQAYDKHRLTRTYAKVRTHWNERQEPTCQLRDLQIPVEQVLVDRQARRKHSQRLLLLRLLLLGPLLLLLLHGAGAAIPAEAAVAHAAAARGALRILLLLLHLLMTGRQPGVRMDRQQRPRACKQEAERSGPAWLVIGGWRRLERNCE